MEDSKKPQNRLQLSLESASDLLVGNAGEIVGK